MYNSEDLLKIKKDYSLNYYIRIRKDTNSFYVGYNLLINGKLERHQIQNSSKWKLPSKIKEQNELKQSISENISDIVINDLIKRDLISFNNSKVNKEITINELFDEYLNLYKQGVRTSTFQTELYSVNKYFIPFFKDNKNIKECFNRPTFYKFNEFINSFDDITLNKKNRLKRRFLKIIQFAINFGYLDPSMMGEAQLCFPLKNDEKPKELTEKVFTIEDFKKYISTFKDDDKWKLFFETLFYTGIRLGEALALRFGDIKLVNNDAQLNIRESRNSRNIISKPKTSSSENVCALPLGLYQKLMDFKKINKAVDEDYVFFLDPISRTTTYRVHLYHEEMAGFLTLDKTKTKILSGIHRNIHCFRKSCGTNLFEHNADLQTVSRQLRHSDMTITAKYYIKYLKNGTFNAVNNLYDETQRNN